MEGSRRGLHLAAYARSAGRAKRKKERLTPTQYMERNSAAGGVKVVVLLLGHKGVSRPDAWLGLIDACPAVALLVHAEVGLPERLESWRFPRSQVTLLGRPVGYGQGTDAHPREFGIAPELISHTHYTGTNLT